MMKLKEGVNAVVFGTCLYVGAVVIIREFHGSHFYDKSQKLGSIETKEKKIYAFLKSSFYVINKPKK